MRGSTAVAALLAAAIASATPALAADPPTLLISDASAVASRLPPPGASAPRDPERRPDLARRLRRWQTGGPVYLWNQEAIAALQNRRQGNLPASRVLATLHAALDDVAVVAEKARPPGSSYPGTVSAMNVAALTILAAMVPQEADRFRALAAEGDTLHRETGLETESDAAAGKAIGEEVARAALARADGDGSQARWTGTVPTGPGRWTTKDGPPIGPAVPQWRTWTIPSADAIRPAAPPEFGSPRFQAALKEVADYARTPVAVDGAIYWAAYGGLRNYTMFHRELAARALEHGFAQDNLRIAAAYAALSLAYADAHIACWDAKYHWWYIRPQQADPSIPSVIPQVAHPSYPSAHACLTGAGTGVLAALFPDERRQFEEALKASGEARISAGLHYRFDVEAGEQIGRRAAEMTMERLAPALR